jgi:Kef-type K+ transport system membrane component KefB
MFLAGLELDLNEFNKNKHKSFVFGFFTFIIPLAIGYPICRYLLGFGFQTSLLVASMLSASTPITYPIVSRLGLSRIQVVGMTIGGTMLTDTAVLFILAVIAGSVGAEIDIHFWVRFLLSVLIFAAIVFLLIPKLTAWFFRNLEGEKYSHFIFVLSMLFLSALLTEIAGLEPIVGAFAAGIALNKLIPRTSPLMNRIEFVGNSLFIPFFLISVGMLINLNSIFKGLPGLIIAGTITIIALLGKYLAAWITSFLFKFPNSYRNLIFGLSSPRAASAIAVILVGFRIGIVDDNIFNGTIVLILISCLVASFVTEHAAKQVLIKDEIDVPNELSFREQKILVPIYNPANMERLLDLAMAIKMPKNPFPIVSLSVVEDDQKAVARLIEAKKMLEKAMVHASASDQKVEIISTISQNVPTGIERVAREIFATEIVIGYSLKSQFTDLLFGNTIKYIVENTWQTIWVCSISPNLYQYKKITVICPTYAEREYGFNQWVSRIFNLADTLQASVDFLSTKQTFVQIDDRVSKKNIKINVRHHEFNNWNDFTRISDYIQPSDLVLIILPRKGGVSYENLQEGIPRQMSKNFESYNFILVYPSVMDTNQELMFANEFDIGLIEKGFIKISKKARSLRGIFQKKS